MEQHPIQEFLNNLPFFKEFSYEEKQMLLTKEQVFHKYKAGEHIIREGEEDDAVFVILKGTVHITKNTLPDVTVSRLTPGSLFGEIALISDRPRSSNAVCNSDVVVMRITKEMIDNLGLPLTKKFQDQMIKILASRLDEMNEKYVKALNEPLKI